MPLSDEKKKRKQKGLLGLVLRRLANPWHLARAIRLQVGRKRTRRAFDDAQLKLFHRILPGDFLHYGYFDDPSVHPMDMTLHMIFRAQERYAEKLLELVKDRERPLLDVGCGMGGLLGLMNRSGIEAVGLTPDVNQAGHIRGKYPNELIECRFEDLDGSKHEGRFGTLITSESLQYLVTDEALPLIDKVLASGGRWVACDYFRIGDSDRKSGHDWSRFGDALKRHRFRISYEEDITPHILPTIAYAHHWASNIGVPLTEFVIGKLRVKSPGIYYVMENAIPVLEERIRRSVDTIDPAVFRAHKRYVLMAIEREAS